MILLFGLAHLMAGFAIVWLGAIVIMAVTGNLR